MQHVDEGNALADAMALAMKPDGLRFTGLGDSASEVYRSKGRSYRVEAHEQPTGRAAVNVRGWVMPDAYPVDPTRKYDRMAFLAKHGPEGCAEYKLGLEDMSSAQAFELAEAIVRAALVVAEHEADEANREAYR